MASDLISSGILPIAWTQSEKSSSLCFFAIQEMEVKS